MPAAMRPNAAPVTAVSGAAFGPALNGVWPRRIWKTPRSVSGASRISVGRTPTTKYASKVSRATLRVYQRSADFFVGPIAEGSLMQSRDAPPLCAAGSIVCGSLGARD